MNNALYNKVELEPRDKGRAMEEFVACQILAWTKCSFFSDILSVKVILTFGKPFLDRLRSTSENLLILHALLVTIFHANLFTSVQGGGISMFIAA